LSGFVSGRKPKRDLVNQKNRVLLLKWQPEVVVGLLARRAEVHVIIDGFDRANGTRIDELRPACAGWHEVSVMDSLEELAAIAAELRLDDVRFDKLFAHTEFSQLAAGYLGDLLSIEGHSSRFHLGVRDKRLMKSLVSAVGGIQRARFESLPADTANLRAWMSRADLRYPLVVKPVAGMSTVATTLVNSDEELLAAATLGAGQELFHSSQMMAEEFIEGSEFHVDALWSGGRPAYFFISRYANPRLSVYSQGPSLKLDGSVVIERSSDPLLWDEAAIMHERVNKALGITEGPTHLEFFQPPDGGLVFSEIGARMGGAFVPLVLEELLAHSPWDYVAAALCDSIDIPVRAVADRTVGGALLRPEVSGTLVALPGDIEFRTIPHLAAWTHMKRPGDSYSASSTCDWVTFAAFNAPCREAYENAVDRAIKEIHYDLA
jgi:hypothetical protein